MEAHIRYAVGFRAYLCEQRLVPLHRAADHVKGDLGKAACELQQQLRVFQRADVADPQGTDIAFRESPGGARGLGE
jgi:hypothetical protein